MADKAYEYMDWPRIEAIVYGEEASPRDVMQPRVTEDGVLIQGFFPGADAAEVVVGDTFFGAAFSIMTFNTDVDVGTLFQKIYFQVTGKISSGFTILEISYSIGLAIGVLFFFNHFSHLKFSADPTPMQVQMRKYEDDVNTTILEDLNREK